MKEIWEDMTKTQRRVVLGLALFFTAVLLTGWINRISLSENRRELQQAKRDSEKALEAAAKIATKLKAAEKALQEKEKIRDEELRKYEQAARRSADARGDYDRARREPVGPDAADADTLCRELAGLGYPCGD